MNKIPLARPYIKKEIVLKEIEKVLDRRWISGGPAINEFEEAIKKYNNDPNGHYIAVANATVGLELALLHANGNQRYKPTDEVIVPSWSWVASGFAIKNVGAKPVWCDINEYGATDAKVCRRLVSSNTKAIMIVHQMGIPCNLDAFKKEFYHKVETSSMSAPGVKTGWFDIPIIEDAACGFGSEYRGDKIGKSLNDVVYSFQARKCLTTGEGGMIVTRNPITAEWYRSMRSFGTSVSPLKRDSVNYLLKEEFTRIGTNYKMSDLQAAMGLAHLQYFEEEIKLRAEAAAYYDQLIAKIFKPASVKPAIIIPDYCTKYNYNNYHVLLNTHYDRDAVIGKLKAQNIGAKWDIQAIHLEPAIGDTHVVLSNTELYHNHGLWLPFFAEITRAEQDHVIKILDDILCEP